MSAPVFRNVGPYEIERQIGRGGMAMVFSARDTRAPDRVVALKVIPVGPDADARDVAEAEQRGAELQRQYLASSQYVPQMYEVGHTPDYLYIAMEYLDGEDLSAVIRRGAIEPEQAARIAVQLCRFLEEIDHLESAAGGGSPLTLLHNDLKPTNIRLVSGEHVKVLDFGAAKALSITRRVTRNDFYSTPYLSPECLDTGERDRQTDAWALGVILYEMVSGAPPFRASDTRRLEDRIRSRRPADPPAAAPRALQAVIAKLLSSDPNDRYPDAAAIREDLERFLADVETAAERDGWPARALDEPPTRRSAAAPAEVADEPPTRRAAVPVAAPVEDEAATRPMPRDSTVLEPASDAAPPAAATTAVPATRSTRARRWLRVAVLVLVLALGVNEAYVWGQARWLAGAVPMHDFAALDRAWSEYRTLRRRSLLGVGTRGLGLALHRQALVLAEGVTANYRTPAPSVREAQWQATVTALERALAVRPDDEVARGMMRYAQGHLHRINGEASKSRRQTAAAQRQFADAVAAFREAAALRPKWPDPFLGLARTFIYGLEDIDRGADAMSQAQKLGYTLGSRETAQLADGYRTRGDALDRAASELGGMPQEKEFLTGARDAYLKALELYTTIANFPDVPAQIRTTQRRLEEVEQKLDEVDEQSGSAPGRILRGIGRILREL
jgi:serine/threonine-protein kinase